MLTQPLDGAQVLTSSEDGHIAIWDTVASNLQLLTRIATSNPVLVTSVAAHFPSAAGCGHGVPWVAVAAADGSLRLWSGAHYSVGAWDWKESAVVQTEEDACGHLDVGFNGALLPRVDLNCC